MITRHAASKATATGDHGEAIISKDDANSTEINCISLSSDSSGSISDEDDDYEYSSCTESEDKSPLRVRRKQNTIIGKRTKDGKEISSQMETIEIRESSESNGDTEEDLENADKDTEDLFSEALQTIEGEGVKKLTINQCKSYLRSHGLRLTGSKSVLINRIQEHIELKNGAGIEKYPRHSFTINCKGDACAGDIVLFKQRIYDQFDLASRSSKQPPLGKRVVAGRIVKESYGAAKQQHTFTVEVLWSRGLRPLPPLSPLIIKGRNLYRLGTFRQPWLHEEERRRILNEKHARGSTARSDRDARIERKPMHANSRQKKKVHKRSNATSAEPTTSQHASLMLPIQASVAGLVIGKHGASINEIIGVTGARVQVCKEPRNPAIRIVEITGRPEQIDHAKELVLQKAQILSCKHFAVGKCRFGSRCRFAHR